MIHVYTKKELIPKNAELIWDVDKFFNKDELKDTEFTRKVLKDFEFGEFLDCDSFIDRLGYKLYKRFMSTSSKVLISINLHPDKCINCIEMGHDAYRLLPDLEDGYIYVSNRDGWVREAFSNFNYNTGNKISVEIDGEVLSWN